MLLCHVLMLLFYIPLFFCTKHISFNLNSLKMNCPANIFYTKETIFAYNYKEIDKACDHNSRPVYSQEASLHCNKNNNNNNSITIIAMFTITLMTVLKHHCTSDVPFLPDTHHTSWIILEIHIFS